MMHPVSWEVQGLVRAEATGAPDRLHLFSNLLGWKTGVPGRLHPLSNLLGWDILHLRSNLLEWH